MEEVSNFSPAMAVPTTVKMPEPITAPMPNAVSDHGPSVFFRECSGSSESLISLSIDLVANNCFRSGQRVRHPKYGEGVVFRREGDGDDAKITVQFAQFGVKKLVEKFAQLEKV